MQQPFSAETPNPSDKSLAVLFFDKAVPNKTKSDEAGRPVHDKKTYLKVVVPGSRDRMERPIKPEDKDRFPKQFQAYQGGAEEVHEGTPLESWSRMDAAQVADWKYQGVFTVNQLADLNDTAISKIGLGARELVKAAQAYLDEAAGHAVSGKLVAELEQKDQQLEAMQQQIDELRALMPAKRGPGRPRKDATE